MNLDELQSVRDRERQTDKLQQLRASFYADAGEFVQQLCEERDRAAERVDNPFDAPEVSRLTDEIDTAKQVVEAIYENRIGKIVKAASLDAAGLPADADGLTDEEQRLFQTLVDDIEHHRENVLAVLDGETTQSADPGQSGSDRDHPAPTDLADGASVPDDAQSAPTAEQTAPENRQTSDPGESVTAADVMGGDTGHDDSQGESGRTEPGSESPTGADEQVHDRPVRKDGGGDGGGDGGVERGTANVAGTGDGSSGSGDDPSVDRETVLVTDDVGTFVGSDDRDYDLETDDVVTLPATNAEILVEQEAAQSLEEPSPR